MQHLYHFEFSRTLGDGLWCANGRRWIMNWVTRERPVIDRIACPWLIARSIDKGAEFLFVLRAARALVVSALGKRYGVKRDFLAQDVVKDLLFAVGPDDETAADRLLEALIALADSAGREDRFFRQRHSVTAAWVGQRLSALVDVPIEVWGRTMILRKKPGLEDNRANVYFVEYDI
jgi:hypothetical protein